MSGLTMDQVPSLRGLRGLGGGAAGIIGAIVGPLAQAGSSIYGDYTDSQQSRQELKQREREFQAMTPILERRQKAEASQAALDTIAAVRQTQIRSGYQALYAPYLLGAVVIGGMALLAVAASRKGAPK